MATKQANVILNFKMNGAVEMAKTTSQMNTLMSNAAKEFRNQINAMGDNATAADKLALQEKKLATQLDITKQRLESLRQAQEISTNKLPGLTEKTKKLKDELEKSKQVLADNKDKHKELQESYFKSIEETGEMSDKTKALKLELSRSSEAIKEAASSSKQLQKDYDSSAKETQKVTTELEKLPGKILDAENSEVTLSRSLKETNEQLRKQSIFSDEAKKKLEDIGKVGNKVSSVGKKLSLVITAPMAAMTAGLIKNGVEVRKFRAQAQIYYEGLYQDTSKAKQQLDDLMTFAKTTPYSYESIVEADQIMQTFGISTSKSKEVLDALANTIASTGGSSQDLSSLATVMGQIESSGKLSLDDMNQLINAKIPALKIVGNELGMSVMDLRDNISKGSITSEQAIDALTKGLMNGTDGINGATQAYSGALGNVKQQLPGAVDSMKSAFKNLSLQLVNENIFDKMINAINKITEMINSGAFIPVIKTLSDILGSVLDKVVGLAEWFSNLDPHMQKVIVKMIAFAGILGPILIVVGNLITAISTIAGVFGTLAAFIGVSQLALLGIIAAIAAVIAAGVWLYKNWDAIKEKGAALFSALGKIFNDMKDSVVNVFKSIGDTISTTWNNILSATKEKINNIVSAASDAWNNFIQFFIDLGTSIKEIFIGIWDSVKEATINAWTSFAETMTPIIDFFVKVITVPISLIATLLDALWTTIKAAMEIAWQAILISAQAVWEKMKTYIITPITQAYDFVVQKFTELFVWISLKWQEFTAQVQLVWNLIKEYIIQPIVDVYNQVTAKISELWTSLVTLFDLIKNSVAEKWESIKQSIVERFTAAKDTVVNIASDIWTSITSKFDSIIQSAKEKFNMVKDAIVNPIIAAKDKIKEVIDNIKNFFSNLKFPKFSLKKSSKTIFGKEIEYPTGIDVSWNANGAIFNRPVVAGNYGGKAQGFGEVPGVSEAAIPLTPENLAAIGRGISANMGGQAIEQHIHINEVHTNNPSDLDRTNRKMYQAAKQAIIDAGGVPG